MLADARSIRQKQMERLTSERYADLDQRRKSQEAMEADKSGLNTGGQAQAQAPELTTFKVTIKP